MRFMLLLGLLIGMGLLSGCGLQGTTIAIPKKVTATLVSVAPPATPWPSGISTETQVSKPSATPAFAPTAHLTPTLPFPQVRYVSPSSLPYDPTETIRILPVYACPVQSCLWLGDLPAGLAVTVTAISQTGEDCYVSGKVVQGWEVEGWVSCSRLIAEPPPIQ